MNRSEQPQPLIDQTAPTSRGEVARSSSGGNVAAQSSLPGPAGEPPPLSPRLSNGPEQSVELHIEELVLHGFEPAHRYAIGDAVERELTRLFTEQGAPSAITHDGETAHLDGSAFEIEPGSNGESIGVQLAKAIHGELGK